jgi:hypothetical protein
MAHRHSQLTSELITSGISVATATTFTNPIGRPPIPMLLDPHPPPRER